MTTTRKKRCAAAACVLMTVALGGCGLIGPYPGMPAMQAQSNDLRARENRPEWIPHSEPDQSRAPPQVAYRIDENRYFEIVPLGRSACTNGDLYYTDKAKGIHSRIYGWQPGYNLRSDFVIDAANEDYLVAPIDRGNTDCSSGGGLCGDAKLPYSTDGGRTWKRGDASSASDDISVSGPVAYAIGNVARRVDLVLGISSLKDWKSVPGYKPNPRKAPLDTKFHCTVNGKE